MRTLARISRRPRTQDPAAGATVDAPVGDRRRGRHVPPVLAGVVVGVLGSAVFVYQGTSAAFTDTTSNGASSWSTGSVELSDDDSGVALFSTGPLVPGDTGSRCLAVTYSGSVAAAVRLYTASVSGTLAPYVLLDVEEGAGAGNVGSAADCTGFSGTSLWSGTLDAFGTSSTSFETGVGAFAPSGTGQVQVYRLTWTLDPAAPDSVQGHGATGTFVWEARS